MIVALLLLIRDIDGDEVYVLSGLSASCGTALVLKSDLGIIHVLLMLLVCILSL